MAAVLMAPNILSMKVTFCNICSPNNDWLTLSTKFASFKQIAPVQHTFIAKITKLFLSFSKSDFSKIFQNFVEKTLLCYVLRIYWISPIQDEHFRGCSRMWGGGCKKAPPVPKTCRTYPTMMKLGTVIPYL